VIEEDMIAVPVGGAQCEVAAASPDYLARHGAPDHPRDLLRHRCIGWRPGPDTAPWRWEFVQDGRHFDVMVDPQVTTNDLRLMLRMALAGGGITFATRDCMRDHLDSGTLVPLLTDYLPPFAGFHLYFPQRKHMAPKLRALVDHVRRWRFAS
jgi:DNA-binding transcriptional LysR family regulator